MCVVSAIGGEWQKTVPYVHPWVAPPPVITVPPEVTREEFNALKREIEELHTLLLAAKRFDEVTGQPDCETDEKVELIKRIAELVGVDMEDVFGP